MGAALHVPTPLNFLSADQFWTTIHVESCFVHVVCADGAGTANSECRSWTVFESQQSTQCSLFRTAGADQQAKSKTGDVRYTSGYLPPDEHPGTDGGVADGADIFLLISVVLGVVYLVVGAAVGWSRNGHHLEIPNHSFWTSVGGMVIDGVCFTGQMLGLLSADGVSPAAEHENNISTVNDGLEEGLLRRQLSGATQKAKQASQGDGTAWHRAAMVGNADKLRVLLKERQPGATELDAGDHRRYTPYMLACAGGHQDCVQLLLSGGCNPALCNDTGRTGYELAAELQRTDLQRYLQNWGGVGVARTGMGAAAAAAASVAPSVAATYDGGERSLGGRKTEGREDCHAHETSTAGSRRKQGTTQSDGTAGSKKLSSNSKTRKSKSGKSRRRSSSEVAEESRASTQGSLSGVRKVQL